MLGCPAGTRYNHLLDPNDDAGRKRLLRICVRIPDKVGINQLRNVFEPAWKSNDENPFQNFLFRDIIRRDRLRRYYQLPDDDDDDRKGRHTTTELSTTGN